ncbi:MAG: D-amino acid aminotransferase [Halothiobacillaceae bacterium]|nr:MAG: D-amino acid aminotransferase [Halothiobacillaceae bacterium]
MSAIVHLNGQFMPLDEARVSVLDRGFLFGDGVYEAIPVYGGRMLRGDEHIERLERSLDGIRIVHPMSRAAWLDMLADLVKKNGGGDQSVYLQVTRGAPPRRDHAFPPEGTPPTVFAMCTPLVPIPATWASEGAAAITVPDIRWLRCDLKTIQLLGNVLARQEAVEQGAAEAILLRDGMAIEGSASNLFIVKDGVVHTTAKSPSILGGITRELVIELAREQGCTVLEAGMPEALLRAADEVWVTSSTREIVPITRVDGAVVGAGVPGPLWQRMYAVYQSFKQQVREGLA